MPDTVIRVENLSKKYIIHHVGAKSGDGLRHLLQDAVAAPFRALRKLGKGRKLVEPTADLRSSASEEFWALKDVSFEVKRGEVLGIIGRNGAGKSTLLKVLSRITEPTSGRIGIKGRVASLLEVGTGFHPELTGRENIFLNGAILGMTRAEIKKKFDEIVAFADVGKFLDTPVKRYSSGMYVRLAFAVAAHLEPEILIVDEVLAVGDAEFQKKCLGKMKDVAGHGRTVLFVSHNMAAVRTLCATAIHLDSGTVCFHGEANAAVDRYHTANEAAISSERYWKQQDAPGDEVLRLRGVTVRSGGDMESGYFPLEEDILVDIEYEVLCFHPRICVSIHLHTEGVCAFVGGNISSPHDPGIFRATGRIPVNLLNTNLYHMTAFLITNTTELRVIERDVVSFSVEESASRSEYVGHVIGVVRPKLEWDTMKINCLTHKAVS